MSRVAGAGSRGWFFLSDFWGGCAGFEAEAIVAGFQDVAMMCEPVEQRGGHFCIAEDTRPLAEAEVGRDDDTGAFVEFAQQVEEQCAA